MGKKGQTASVFRKFPGFARSSIW